MEGFSKTDSGIFHKQGRVPPIVCFVLTQHVINWFRIPDPSGMCFMFLLYFFRLIWDLKLIDTFLSFYGIFHYFKGPSPILFPRKCFREHFLIIFWRVFQTSTKLYQHFSDRILIWITLSPFLMSLII